MEMLIGYLKDYAHLVKEVSQYFYKEGSYLCPERNLIDFENSILERLNYDTIPLALVAVRDNQFVGTVCLKEYDMNTRKDLSPWLAGVYVKEGLRNLGIGKLLIEEAINEARKLKVETLYLYTPNAENYYEKLGWEVISYEKYQSSDVCVMKKCLNFIM